MRLTQGRALLLAFVLAVLAIPVGLSVHAQHPPGTEPAATAWTPPAAADPADAAFLTALHQRGVDPPKPDVAINLGRLTCQSMKLGTAREWLVEEYVRQGVDRAVSRSLTDAAVEVYCPEQG